MYDVLEVQPQRGAREIVERLPLDRAVLYVRVPGVSPAAVEYMVDRGALRVRNTRRTGRTRWVSIRELRAAAGTLRARTEVSL